MLSYFVVEYFAAGLRVVLDMFFGLNLRVAPLVLSLKIRIPIM